ncbi:MAG: acyl-CoA thioesterase II [Flavobacteriales bacterium]|jgi:acyl-CoA thioesterase-2|nr:acyl-CoA thioesterase II [Flavobacteriales bacterium]
MKTLKSLFQRIKLQRKSENSFEGENFFTPWGRVYGGQVLAQALHAAYQTVPKDRFAHSLHSYFILGGDLNLPVQYEVDIVRDGGSFTTRRVIAKQKGKAMFILAASFQIVEEGVTHQECFPNFTPPVAEDISKDLLESTDMDRANAILKGMEIDQVFRFLPLGKQIMENGLSQVKFWTQSSSWEGFGIAEKQQLLAFISDFGLMSAMSLPHEETLQKKAVMMASLDHALWFHRPLEVTQGVLSVLESPSTSNARGFARGNIFDAEGNLISSVAQEGLFRVH